MKYFSSILAGMVLFTIMSCQSTAQKTTDAIHFGEKIDETDAISVDAALAQLSEGEEIETKVVGTVLSVCQVKGCWMNLVSDNDESKSFFVKFKDYEFFVPKDLSGSKVVVEGKAYKELTTVDELKHYAEDEGASQEEIDAITEPKEEYKFMANGVKIVKRI